MRFSSRLIRDGRVGSVSAMDGRRSFPWSLMVQSRGRQPHSNLRPIRLRSFLCVSINRSWCSICGISLCLCVCAGCAPSKGAACARRRPTRRRGFCFCLFCSAKAARRAPGKMGAGMGEGRGEGCRREWWRAAFGARAAGAKFLYRRLHIDRHMPTR